MKHIIIIMLLCRLCQIEAQDLIPLANGNSWTYEASDSSGSITHEITNKATIFQNANGHLWYHLMEFGSSYIVRNDEKGQWEADSVSIVLKENDIYEELMFKNPTKEIQKYTVYDKVHVKVASHTTKVENKAGKFNAYEYTVTSGDSKMIYRLCPGVGTVSFTYILGSSYEHYELISYHLK